MHGISDWTIVPGGLKGAVDVPPSKSQTIRAMVFALLAEGTSHIENSLLSPDVTAMARACRLFGGDVASAAGSLTIRGVGGHLQTPCDVIDAGNSGLVLRFAGALGALTPGYTVVTGDASIRCQRPVSPLLHGLQGLGATALSSRGNGAAPILIKGPIAPGRTSLDGADSQPVSSLLVAAATLDGVTEIEVIDPGETPWVELTMAWLRRAGVAVVHQDYRYYHIQGPLSHRGFSYRVPGDFSSALFPTVAALATGSSVALRGLDRNDAQGDKKVLALMQQQGAHIEWQQGDTLVVSGCKGRWRGGAVDINAFIDALPALAVLACSADGETTLYNGAIARAKESDRIASITSELRKMGADITEHPDGLSIRPSPLKGAVVDSHGDHRIALALAAAALTATGPTTVTGVGCVEKTYPSFCRDMQALGVEFL